MINILVFGDSNSWGFVDEDDGKKYSLRWPIVLKNDLKNQNLDCCILEDSLPGRTTNLNDEQDGHHLNGASVFKSSLLSHSPIDIVIILLGTNDLKKRFNRNSDDIADGIKNLINISKNTPSGKGTWHDQNFPEIIVICPPILGPLSNNSQWQKHEEWEGGFNKSINLYKSLNIICTNNQVQLIDSNQFIESSSIDPIHWSKKSHHLLGKEISKIILSKFKS